MRFFEKRKIINAIEQRDLRGLRELLDNGSNVNLDLGGGRKPLHVAADTGAKDIIQLLVDRGAEVNALKEYNWAPIHDAAYRGNFDAVVTLLKAGADPNLRTDEGRTAHGWAVVRKHPEVAELLSPYMKKAIEIAQENSLKTVPAPQPGWTMLSDGEIARTTAHDQLHYRLTDIFNFRDRERIRIVHNIDTKTDSVESRSFDDMADKTPIENARQELLSRGGHAPEEAAGWLNKLPRPANP